LDFKRALLGPQKGIFCNPKGRYLQAVWWSLQNQHMKNMNKTASFEVWSEKGFLLGLAFEK
jgi:hypothetical protein